MWCGEPLYVQCPSGHAVWLGHAHCPVCGASVAAQSTGATAAPVDWAAPPAPVPVPVSAPLPDLLLPTGATNPRRRNSIILAASTAVIAVVTIVAGALIGTSSSQRSGPLTPEDPIAGPALTLPAALFLANAPGSAQPLVTPNQAVTVSTEMWRLWQQALVRNDTRALSQLTPPGFLRQGVLYNCVWPQGGCVQQGSPLTMESVVPVVPVQRAYPLYFMAQITTKSYVQKQSGGPSVLEPWLDLQILTKASPSSPWRISFDSGYNAADGSAPPLLPVDSVALPCTSPHTRCLEYNPAPDRTPPVAADRYLPLLAGYWQSWKVNRAAPAHTLFVRDGDTSGFGSSIAQTPQDSHDRYDFHLDAAQGVWSFSAGGYPMMCGTIVDTSDTLSASGSMNQNPDRTNWGMQLPPGRYSSIVTQTTHQSCVYMRPYGTPGLDAAGVDGYAATITGTPEG